jgi:hypothetical protein
MQCGAFVPPKGKSNSQSGWRTVQTNLGFLFQDLNQKLKFSTTMSTDPKPLQTFRRNSLPQPLRRRGERIATRRLLGNLKFLINQRLSPYGEREGGFYFLFKSKYE